MKTNNSEAEYQDAISKFLVCVFPFLTLLTLCGLVQNVVDGFGFLHILLYCGAVITGYLSFVFFIAARVAEKSTEK